MKRGFTLIELLVVIAIIGLLSSVVLATLNTARLRSNDAAVKQQAAQLRNLYQLEYSDTGTYTNLQQGTWSGSGSGATCNTFAGNYASEAQKVCIGITKVTVGCPSNACLVTGPIPAGATAFSIMVYLPYESAKAGSGRYLCLGSSGRQSIVPWDWTNPGCYSNP
jgi:prepilin-type N-terminal cleavage/methylation domain-containing protein